MTRSFKRYQAWLYFSVFLALAYAFGSREGFVTTTSPFATGKAVVFVIFVLFLAYSIYANSRENFFRTLATMNGLWWGRQIGIDLYISVALSLVVVYLVEGSLVVTLIWAVPIVIFANLAILPYLLLNFAAVTAYFPG